MAILIFGLRMAKQSSLNLFINAKLYVMYRLAFLVVVFFCGCENSSQKLELIWKNNLAIGIAIPKNQSNLDSLRIVNVKSVFGSFTKQDNWIEFKPVIPLTPGLIYEVWNGAKLIGKIGVPLPNTKLAPVLTAIFPEIDTVPENLLKFYFVFSKPMQTGQSLGHIYLLAKNGDTLRNIFLNLQPELWDTSGRVLTIWLDPGRIKRDLVLNKKLGNPLTQNDRYTLAISNQWKDTQGLHLKKEVTKSFVVGTADHEIPAVNEWTLSLPKANTKGKFIIDTKSSLDYFLFNESLTLFDANNKPVEGQVTIKKDRIWEFVPRKPWQESTYTLQVNTRLEDLAGNNINRLFDRDIRKDKGRDDKIVKRKLSLNR